MREVRQIADRVTVLRASRVVLADTAAATLTDADLVTAMVGENVVAVRNPGQDTDPSRSCKPADCG
jgi:ABC-type sugar transport system ATPase subunit